MSYEITLHQFSGPLDLLLHLIQKQELDIYDIPISQITEQYMDYLQAMEDLSLEIASEFVVMAATLLAIKSRMLLPRPPKADAMEEFMLDPREELVQQLLEYQRCQWAAKHLREKEALQAQIFSRDPLDLRPFTSDEFPKVEGVNIWDLVDAFRKLYLRLPKTERIAEIRGHVVRVEDMMDKILERLQRWKICSFRELLSIVTSRASVVSAFLALLELVKDGIVYCQQESTFAEIEIGLKDEVTLDDNRYDGTT